MNKNKFEIEDDLKERIAEAVNYLIIKNKNFEIPEGADVLYDKAERKYYDLKTGQLVKKGQKGIYR